MVSVRRERNKKNTNPTIPEAHIKSVEEDICIRIRPEELTASAKFSIAELPVDFLKVQLPASEIKAALL